MTLLEFLTTASEDLTWSHTHFPPPPDHHEYAVFVTLCGFDTSSNEQWSWAIVEPGEGNGADTTIEIAYDIQLWRPFEEETGAYHDEPFLVLPLGQDLVPGQLPTSDLPLEVVSAWSDNAVNAALATWCANKGLTHHFTYDPAFVSAAFADFSVEIAAEKAAELIRTHQGR